jgi:hypothetical protein
MAGMRLCSLAMKSFGPVVTMVKVSSQSLTIRKMDDVRAWEANVYAERPGLREALLEAVAEAEGRGWHAPPSA